MKKLEKPLSASETLQLLDTQWARKKDIMNIGFIGDTKASQILNEITTDYENKGYKLPRGLVPMEAVAEYFKINIPYLKKVSKNEIKKVTSNDAILIN